jgi:uncharacterized protein (TIGR01777 family)
METVGIFGGSGFTGTALTQLLLQSGYRVIIFSRQARETSTPNLQYSAWQPDTEQIDNTAFCSLDHIINLSGAGIADKRWTPARKQLIIQSRTTSTSFLARCLQSLPHRVRTHINASASGYYGPSIGTHSFTEQDPPASDYLGQTCQAWEASAQPIAAITRLVILRFGIVLGREGGMLGAFKPALALHLAPIMGGGQQWIGWIHLQDLCRMMLYALQHTEMNGAYNAAAPEPAQQKQLVYAVAKAACGWFIPAPAPAFVLKAMLGEMSGQLLQSNRMSAHKIQEAGFVFAFPDIDTAARDLYR